MLLLPISIARSICLQFNLLEESRRRPQPADTLPFRLQNESSIPIDPLGSPDQDAVRHFDSDLLATKPETRFPASRKGIKTTLFEFSIAPVEVLNQSPNKRLTTYVLLGQLYNR